ncbi:MAG TPA: trehalase family glycosidase [Acidimicrobiia bacterium]
MTIAGDAADLRAGALAVLDRNRRGGYTVPAEGLYPYQWCWDAGPIALGWAAAGHWDEAWSELRTLLSAQWDSGFVPHIVFWVPGDDYFPGPEVWGTRHDPETTGITQPPLPLVAAARLYVGDPDRQRARRELSPLWPRLIAWVAWLARARTGPHGACVVVHPWESGMDNSPCWDAPLARVPRADDLDLRRRDLETVAAARRPTERDYRHYLGIVQVLRDAGWDTERQVEVSPFAVEDPAFTAIAARGARELAGVATDLGADGRVFTEFARAAGDGLARLWDEDAGWFRPYDLRGETALEPLTASGLVAAWCDEVSGVQVARMLARVDDWSGHVAELVTTCDPSATEFDAQRYWRGPVWVLVNWLVAEGLARVGEHPRAEALRQSTLRLVATHGFTEYYDPITGEGIGGRAFSWSAALTLAWLLPHDFARSA